MAKSRLATLVERARSATGRDAELDAAIAEALEPDCERGEAPPYTGSVDSCIELIHRVLPGWGWHVGYGPKGILPYAALTHESYRHEGSAPTVPLALLIAMLQACISERRRGNQ